MSNWTHVNCVVRGEFNRDILIEMFGRPAIPYCCRNKYEYSTPEYDAITDKIYASHEQSKLPKGEEPLNWRLYSPDQVSNDPDGGSCWTCDSDVLTITGDLRWYDMDDEGVAEMQGICQSILDAFPYDVRSLVMHVYEEYSGKVYIWHSMFNDKLQLYVCDRYKEDM